MNEILFKGKSVDNGEWIEGFYCPVCFGYFPCCPAIVSKEEMDNGCWRPVEVDPETIVQYTGLTDKNGKKIFEGDIVQYGLYPCVIKYDIDNARFMLFENGEYLKNGFNVDTMKLKEVIGNIHDNPELLKGG